MNKFIIIGSSNAITYKEVFSHIMSGEVFARTMRDTLGFSFNFVNDKGEEKIVPSLWYTNLDSRHLYKTLELTKTYDLEKYPKYDNYDAIEVSRIKDIPHDYNGVMGVPITFVTRHVPEFEIIGCADAGIVPEGWKGMTKEFIDLYHAQGGTGYSIGNILAHYISRGGKTKIPYKRVLIRKEKK